MSAEQKEICRLRAELARVKMKRDVLGKATAAQAACAEPVLIEVRLHQPSSPPVADLGAVPSARGKRGRISRALRAAASAAQRRHLSDDVLLVHIKAIHAETHGGYGWPRTCK